MNDAPPSRLVIDVAAYAHNLGVVREMLPDDCGIIAVVKADAYGLGATYMAMQALSQGIGMLGVATVEEGVLLREAGITSDILVLVQPAADALGSVLDHDLKVTISDLPTAEKLGEMARRARKVATVHCKIDTGMGRQGFSSEDAANEVLTITRISNVDIEGVSTHFPTANIEDDAFTLNQIRGFKNVLRSFAKAGIPYEIAHAANSAAVVNYPTSAFDFVRVGLMSYGVWPTDTPPQESPLEPVVRWISKVILVRDLPGGVTIGYGRTHKTDSPTKIAVIPVGYADGYPYRLSNRGDVLIGGRRCPVRGRVSMDTIVVDVTHAENVTPGDTATLFGQDGHEIITVEEMAQKAGTIPYDILSGIGGRVGREYTA